MEFIVNGTKYIKFEAGTVSVVVTSPSDSRRCMKLGLIGQFVTVNNDDVIVDVSTNLNITFDELYDML